MTKRILKITVAALAISGFAMTGTAQAGVTGSAKAMQSSAHSLGMIEQVRRICRPVLRCGKFPQGCHWRQECHVTADYPPEHGRR